MAWAGDRWALAFASGFADTALEVTLKGAFGPGCVSVGYGANHGVTQLVDGLLIELIWLLLEYGFGWNQADSAWS